MSKGRALVLFSVALLAIGLAALLYSGIVPWPLGAQPKSYVSRMYVVSFVWENGLKDLRLIDWKTGEEEPDSALLAEALKEANDFLPEIISWTRLNRAQGRFNVKLQGYGEPYLIERGGISITKPDLTRWLTAAEVGAIEIVKQELESGTEVNARRPYTGRTALMWASTNPDPSMVEFLLAAGANPNEKDAEGRTPLTYANAATAELLLAAGADVNAADDDGHPALFDGILHDRLGMVRLLLGAGSDVNTRDKKGRTPLMWAASMGREEIVKLLLASGADVNARDNEGRTALFYASRIRKPTPAQKAVIDLLEKAGAKE